VLGWKNFFGLDGYYVLDGNFRNATLDVQPVAIPENLVAGDVEAGAAAEDDVIGACGNTRSEKHQACNGGVSGRVQAHSGSSGRAKRRWPRRRRHCHSFG